MKNGDGYVGHAGVVLVAEHGAPEETAPLEVDDEVMLREEIRPEDWSCHVRYQEALLDHSATGEFDRHTPSPISVDRRTCLLYTSPSPRDLSTSRMPSSA